VYIWNIAPRRRKYTGTIIGSGDDFFNICNALHRIKLISARLQFQITAYGHFSTIPDIAHLGVATSI
jgi:hypothetical protein